MAGVNLVPAVHAQTDPENTPRLASRNKSGISKDTKRHCIKSDGPEIFGFSSRCKQNTYFILLVCQKKGGYPHGPSKSPRVMRLLYLATLN